MESKIAVEMVTWQTWKEKGWVLAVLPGDMLIAYHPYHKTAVAPAKKFDTIIKRLAPDLWDLAQAQAGQPAVVISRNGAVIPSHSCNF